MAKISLSATSALVLLWTDKSLYSTKVVQSYLDMLDLSSGIDLFEKCNGIWPSYGSVINNRKWLIAKWSKEILSFRDIKQVVILAAGWAPLGLELADTYKESSVFEVDLEFMDAKSQLVSKISDAPRNIRFVTADICDHKQCQNLLEDAGWRSNAPTLLIYEGISYYINRSALVNLFGLASDHSRAILEYMIPYAQVDADRREIPIDVFRTITNTCLMRTPIVTWDVSEISQQVPGRVIRRATLCDIERMRFGNNHQHPTLFPTPSSGWIEIVDIGVESL